MQRQGQFRDRCRAAGLVRTSRTIVDTASRERLRTVAPRLLIRFASTGFEHFRLAAS